MRARGSGCGVDTWYGVMCRTPYASMPSVGIFSRSTFGSVLAWHVSAAGKETGRPPGVGVMVRAWGAFRTLLGHAVSDGPQVPKQSWHWDNFNWQNCLAHSLNALSVWNHVDGRADMCPDHGIIHLPDHFVLHSRLLGLGMPRRASTSPSSDTMG